MYPHPNKWINLLDKFLLIIAGIAPFSVLPQIIKIVSEKSAEGVSLITWVFFALIAVPWIVYGVVHKEKPIIVGYLLWFAMDLTVIIAVLVFS
jgi:uncharacterized protein with PQ loop repeat